MVDPPSPDVEPFDPVYVELAARIVGVLRHPTRLHLVLLVAQGETHVSRLSELLELPQSNVSHHLGLLRNMGLVADRRDGQYVRYRLHTPTWQLLANGFFDHLLEGSDRVRLSNVEIRRIREPDAAPAGSPDGPEPPCDPEGVAPEPAGERGKRRKKKRKKRK
jgi:DNA-binding transcriptional ArsR family regulator